MRSGSDTFGLRTRPASATRGDRPQRRTGHARGHRRGQHPPGRPVGARPAQRRSRGDRGRGSRDQRRRPPGPDCRPRSGGRPGGDDVARCTGPPTLRHVRCGRRGAGRVSPRSAARTACAARRPPGRPRRSRRPDSTRCCPWWPISTTPACCTAADPPLRVPFRRAPVPSSRRAGAVRHRAGQHFAALDRMCLDRRLSPGGSGDLLSATLFLDTLHERTSAPCKP